MHILIEFLDFIFEEARPKICADCAIKVSMWYSTIFEDPVTGSAHCSLIPYWSKELNKKKMQAMQLSARKGKLLCEDKGERVLISGKATTYSIGNIWIDQD